MSSFASMSIQCPFYLRDDPKACKLTCEGMLPGSSVTNHFLNGNDLRRQIKKYCEDNYVKCPWYIVLTNVKYYDS